jgi:hypothetical protein
MRRVFLTVGEVPGLVVGVLKGDPVALRRILGARRGGRFGTLLFAVGLLLAFPLRWVVVGAVLQIITVPLLRAWPPAGAGLSFVERLRLSLWTTGPALVVAGVALSLWVGGPVPGLLGLGVGQAILIRGLRSGLRPPGP